MIAVISRKAPIAPPWSAGRKGLPISRSEKASTAVSSSPRRSKLDPEIARIGHGLGHAGQRGVAALLDHLHRLVRPPPARRHHRRSTVKAPAAVATGSSGASVQATARVKATVRVIR